MGPLSISHSLPLLLALAVVPIAFATACELSEPDDDEQTGGTAGAGGSAASAGAGSAGSAGMTTGGSAGAASGGSAATGGSNGGSAGTTATGGTGATAGSAGSGGSGAMSGNGGFSGSGASGASSGTAGSGGNAGATGGAAGTGNAGSAGNAGAGSGLGTGMMMGSGRSTEQYETAEVSRNGVPYILITNGWGPGFESHTVSWEGTSFIVEAMAGTAGSMGQPASYPSVFCGKYSVMQVPACGLPAALDSITSLRTGWRWAANGNEGQYNAAYDIWLGNGTMLQGYLMVWLRDPSEFQPAGMALTEHQGVSVANVPGMWDIWSGTVNRLPITNWVRRQGAEDTELEFDVMDFIRDAEMRGVSVPGTHVNAVAIGFEIWEGPIANLETLDFYVEVN